MAIETLKKRSEFLRLRGGARAQCAAFVLETKPRDDFTRQPDATGPSDMRGPRFGFTVTKALGNAVRRNRIRRRLKAAIAAVAPAAARPSHDYVLIARAPAFDRAFEDLKKDLEQAFQRVHHAPVRRRDRS